MGYYVVCGGDGVCIRLLKDCRRNVCIGQIHSSTGAFTVDVISGVDFCANKQCLSRCVNNVPYCLYNTTIDST